ncbi:sulfatase [Ravibacter arvi]|uniref:Sulfatase n=1 Tax=Ravibacter arvi TaxID=2051041 RepID=A0ABP8LMI2_9BACT
MRPNILFAIADDQSFPHASAYGSKTFLTPAFDNVAARGVLFNNAFVAAPQCSPSRAALLTGRNIWHLEEAGTHSSYFPKKFPVFTDALEKSGYFIGYTGKPWGPGNFEEAGWHRNPVGPAYNTHQVKARPAEGISRNDYASNFSEFLSKRPAGQPFFFWYGGQEPHRGYEAGSGAKSGLTIARSEIPGFLPPADTITSDLLDYALEIGWFDSHLGKMLAMLKERGELDNTIVVVTADNGMAFPYAKANLQESGIHVPLAVCGPGVSGKARRVDDLVSLPDLCPTFLEAAGLPAFVGTTAHSLWPVLKNRKSGHIDPERNYILAGRERHTHARPDNLGYPARAIRTADYLYIVNFFPERWPLGDPPPRNNSTAAASDSKPIAGGYEDIDSSPSKTFLITHRATYPDLFRIAFEKRGSEELYDIRTDPYCLQNLVLTGSTEKIRRELKKELLEKLARQGDPRVTGGGEVFDSYPRFGPMRPFDGFKERGAYNPAFIPKKH